MADDRWFEPLRAPCEQACAAAGSVLTDVAIFYLARWGQKQTGDAVPDLDRLSEGELGDVAEKIAHNLAEEGDTVDRLIVAEDSEAWSELRDRLTASASARAGGAGREHADEALSKIALVLLTGTPPARAAERLREEGPDGPANEYIFTSPFSYWALSVVKNLVIDRGRAAQRERTGPPVPPPRKAPAVDRRSLGDANEALPGLLDAVRELPPAQRAALTTTLSRGELDELVRERLHELAPDLFSDASGHGLSSDEQIAAHLGTTPRRLAANRSAARRKLATSDERWALLLDALLPHRSTRPVESSSSDAKPLARSNRGSDER